MTSSFPERLAALRAEWDGRQNYDPYAVDPFVERLFALCRDLSGNISPYMGFLPSGAAMYGPKHAMLEMHAAIWRAEPTTECAGQSWRDFAERCDRARTDAEQRFAEAKKLADELLAGVVSPPVGTE